MSRPFINGCKPKSMPRLAYYQHSRQLNHHQVEYPRVWAKLGGSTSKQRMVKEDSGSLDWNRIQAKLWCSLPSAELVSLQRVENQKLWRAFEAPVTEYRDAGGHVHVGHHASGVKEVCALELLTACNCITTKISQHQRDAHTVGSHTTLVLNVSPVVGMVQ